MDEMEARGLKALIKTQDEEIKQLKESVGRKNALLAALYYDLNKAGNLPSDETKNRDIWRDHYYELAKRANEESARA